VNCLHFITLSLSHFLLKLFTLCRTKREKHTFDFLYVKHWKIDNKDDFDNSLTKVITGFLHILTDGFPGLFHDFKPNVHDQTEISV